VLKRLVSDGIPVTDFHREERRLEEAFIDMLGHLQKKNGAPTPPLPLTGPPPLPSESSR
jgi:ABC-2 type transport system ATP-binding protein